MSYDLRVWTVGRFDDAAVLPNADWTSREGAWSTSGRGWILNVGTSHEVLPEDIPEEVNAALPGIRYLTELSLEPLGAPKAARTLLLRTAQSVAKKAHGAVSDPQEDTVELPAGVKRFAAVPREERVSLLTFSWWFTHDDLLRRDGIDRVVRALESEIPEALPRRYGAYEPPQFQLETTGRAHLVEFLERHAEELVVWYAHRPVVGLHRSVRAPSRWQRLGKTEQYRCQYLSIDVEQMALAQPGWPTALRRLWRCISRELRPLYGEVRTLRGYVRSGARIGIDRETESNPTRSWWWKGIPSNVGHAFVVGPPYVDLWPELNARATADGLLRFVETTDWAGNEDAAALVGGVPPRLASVEQPMIAPHTWPEPAYPPIFPFPRGSELSTPRA
jgi:hypothetical protein